MPLILIIEDEPGIQELLVELVGALGYRTSVVGTVADAMTLVQIDRPDHPARHDAA